MASFVKMQGLGNDFVVLDQRAEGRPIEPAGGIALCDRHRGIGADGVLSIMSSERAAFAMHVTNPDGSIAEMCGNGLRCVVRYAVDRGLLPPAGGLVETGRGVLECHVESDGQIRVDMGTPAIGECYRLDVAGERLALTDVSMGNPHAVSFVEGDRSLYDWATHVGPAIERHPRFPQRTNAEFARMRNPGEIDLVVWERGAGLTQACGTGACATAVAAIVGGRAKAGEPILIRLPGGPLRVRVEQGFARIWMTGPAVEVFTGEVRR